MAEAAFESFDWTDERWTSYIGSVTIPADRPEDITIQRLKRKWFKKTIDDSLAFDASTSTGEPSAAPSSSTDSQPSAAGPAPAPAPAPAPVSAPTSLKEFVLRRDSLYYLMSIWLLYNAVLYLLPFDAALSRQAYHRACNVAFLKSMMKLFQTRGSPSPSGIWRTIKGVMNKDYQAALTMQAVVNDKNMHNSFLYFMFNSAPPVPFAIFPVALTSLYTVANYTSGLLEMTVPPLHRLLGPLLQKVVIRGKHNPETGYVDMFYWIACAEFCILVALILQLFTPARSFMLVLVFGQFLLIRYTSTGQSGLHTRMAAGQIDAKISVLTKKVGFIDNLYCKAKAQVSKLTRR